jgi:hypothetical protein
VEQKWRYRDPRYPDKIITVDRGDACQGIPISRGSENRGSRQQRTLACWIRDTRYPDGDVAVWDHGKLVEYRWHCIGGSSCARVPLLSILPLMAMPIPPVGIYRPLLPTTLALCRSPWCLPGSSCSNLCLTLTFVRLCLSFEGSRREVPSGTKTERPWKARHPPTFAPMLISSPSSSTQSSPDQCGLPPLSSPWACRVEWFDLQGNSLRNAPGPLPDLASTSQPALARPSSPPPFAPSPPPSAPPSPSFVPSLEEFNAQTQELQLEVTQGQALLQSDCASCPRL